MYQVSDEDRKELLKYLSTKPYIEVVSRSQTLNILVNKEDKRLNGKAEK